jgi:hypothetical protein
MMAGFHPLRLAALDTSPEFGGGREGVLSKITLKDEFANNVVIDPAVDVRLLTID